MLLPKNYFQQLILNVYSIIGKKLYVTLKVKSMLTFE